MKRYEQMLAVCQSIHRNTMGVGAVVETEPSMNKGGNPWLGRVKKVTRYTNLSLGRDYENAVNNRLEGQGCERTFKTEAAKGRHWFVYPWIEQSNKDEEQFYVRLNFNENTKIESVYFVDGREATADEVESIKGFLKSKSPSAKQSASGLETHQVKVIAPKVENVKALWQGDKAYIFAEESAEVEVVGA